MEEQKFCFLQCTYHNLLLRHRLRSTHKLELSKYHHPTGTHRPRWWTRLSLCQLQQARSVFIGLHISRSFPCLLCPLRGKCQLQGTPLWIKWRNPIWCWLLSDLSWPYMRMVCLVSYKWERFCIDGVSTKWHTKLWVTWGLFINHFST